MNFLRQKAKFQIVGFPINHDIKQIIIPSNISSQGIEVSEIISVLSQLENVIHNIRAVLMSKFPKQPSRGVLRKRCFQNMQQIYRRTPMPKCDFN